MKLKRKIHINSLIIATTTKRPPAPVQISKQNITPGWLHEMLFNINDHHTTVDTHTHTHKDTFNFNREKRKKYNIFTSEEGDGWLTISHIECVCE